MPQNPRENAPRINEIEKEVWIYLFAKLVRSRAVLDGLGSM